MKAVLIGITIASRKVFLALAIMTLIALTSSENVTPVVAQSGGGYDLTWNVIADGGAMFSVGGPYSLYGTIGQPDSGAMSGGAYTLVGGFWSSLQNLVSYSLHLFLPLVQNGQ